MCKKVIVTDISDKASEKTVKDFFLFCGKIKEFELIKEESNDKQLAYVTFERDTAAKTALMLTNAVIGDSQITVRPADDDQSYNDDSDDCDIQASKPKAAIFAEILAAGYTLQDAILEKGIEFDSKFGFSNYFKQYLAQIQANRTFDFVKNLDQHYKVTETVTTRATDIDKKYSVLNNAKFVIDQAQDRVNNLLETSAGKMICEYLFCTQKQVADVQSLARKIAGDYKITGATPAKEIQEIVHVPGPHMLRRPTPVPEIHVDIGRQEHRVVVKSDKVSSGESRGTVGSGCETTSSFGSGSVGGIGPEVSHLGWGRWYTLRELEDATGGLCPENVLGEGGYGIVYHGVLTDGTKVAVKNLLNNKGQAEKEFKVEVEAIGRVRHKNLVRLLGYCVEGAYRMLVYEYVDNGNLEQWLHGDVGPVSPLTWEIRMNVILGTARGLAYLHEGLEPKVVHRDVKSSNILLDRQWNSKVSDFGLAKLLNSENSYVTTRVMGTFGYVAPEYACTGMLTEKSDVYSFGILIMELITGRSPVDYGRPQGEVNLIEWLKTMVGNRKAEEVVDPKLPELPSSKALKRALLIALRCVDPDATKRPKMGHVIHMLEADDLLFHNDRKTGGESSQSLNDFQPEHEDSNLDKRTDEGISGQSEHGSGRNDNHQSRR